VRNELDATPADALRELYDSLDLKITYDAARKRSNSRQLASKVCSVPPAGATPTTAPRDAWM
jgi:hypothetical protein